MKEIDVNEIFQKLRTRADIKNFSGSKVYIHLSLNILYILFIALYYLDGYQFGKAFVLGVLNGQKKLLPLGCFGGFNIPYYSKNKKLVKEDIFKEYNGDQNLLSYLPDSPDIKSLSRELLLSILFYADREKYLNLYDNTKICKSNALLQAIENSSHK